MATPSPGELPIIQATMDLTRLVEEVGRQLGAGSASSGAGARQRLRLEPPMAKPQTPLHDLYLRVRAFATLLAACAAKLEAELFQRQHELLSFTDAPGPYRQFTIREPKPRLFAPHGFAHGLPAPAPLA